MVQRVCVGGHFLRRPSRLDQKSHGLNPDQTGADQWPISGRLRSGASRRADVEEVGIEAEMADTMTRT